MKSRWTPNENRQNCDVWKFPRNHFCSTDSFFHRYFSTGGKKVIHLFTSKWKKTELEKLPRQSKLRNRRRKLKKTVFCAISVSFCLYLSCSPLGSHGCSQGASGHAFVANVVPTHGSTGFPLLVALGRMYEQMDAKSWTWIIKIDRFPLVSEGFSCDLGHN